MNDLIGNIVPFVRYPSLIVGGIYLAIAIASYIRSEDNKGKAEFLRNHCDNLSHDIKLLSEKWKA
jgi:hypothetical protein